jgi:predicted lipoprotein with Yx(FWY)xxD motif
MAAGLRWGVAGAGLRRRAADGGRRRTAGGSCAGRLAPARGWTRLAAGAACMCLAACGSAHAAPGPPAWQVRAGQVRGLGTIVTDGRGFTLYVYQPDNRGPSVCTGLCAIQWPPLTLPHGVSRPVAGPGVNPALLGTTRRAGGAIQVTYNRWPLYLWQGDVTPGQATGQADGMGAWYVLSVSGSVDRLPLP